DQRQGALNAAVRLSADSLACRHFRLADAFLRAGFAFFSVAFSRRFLLAHNLGASQYQLGIEHRGVGELPRANLRDAIYKPVFGHWYVSARGQRMRVKRATWPACTGKDFGELSPSAD